MNTTEILQSLPTLPISDRLQIASRPSSRATIATADSRAASATMAIDGDRGIDCCL